MCWQLAEVCIMLTDMQLDSCQPACNAQMLTEDSEPWDRQQV